MHVKSKRLTMILVLVILMFVMQFFSVMCQLVVLNNSNEKKDYMETNLIDLHSVNNRLQVIENNMEKWDKQTLELMVSLNDITPLMLKLNKKY